MKFIAVSILVLLIAAGPPVPLHAQDREEVTLEEVVVTATRDVEEIRKVPANVTVITREAIKDSTAQATVDLLRDEVGVVVRDVYGTGKTASVDIRGFGESAPQNVLVLVDGRRVNEIDLSGTDWSQIPIGQVERIEIVRGAGSVLYGDNAVGGVINIITRRPEKPISGSVEGVLGSYDYHRISGSAGMKWGAVSANLNAGYHDTEGYRDNGMFRAKDVGGRLICDASDRISLNFSGSLHSDKAGFPGGLTLADIERLGRRGTKNPDDTAETDDGYGALGFAGRFGDDGSLLADFSYRRREVKDSFPSSSFTDRREVDTWGFTPRYIYEGPLGGFRNKATVGVDVYRSDMDVSSESFLGPGRSSVKKKSAGLYGYDEFSLLDNLLFSAGFREEWVTFDLFQSDPHLSDTVRDHQPAWNLGLDYLFAGKSSAFLSYRRSFRFPVSDELIQYVFIDPNLIARVNPNIKAQTGDHYEAGIRYAFADWIEGSATLFWIETRDEIFFNPVTFTNSNFPKTRRQGIEVGARAKPLPWLSLSGNYSYTRPLLRADLASLPDVKGNDIPAVPRHKGSFGADVGPYMGFLFSLKWTGIGSRYLISDYPNRADKLDAYSTTDVKLSYSWKALTAFIGVNNVFDEKYSDYGVFGSVNGVLTSVFYPSPTRNFIGGLSYAF
jgi:iron complex outermembrane recepter protein